MIVCEQIHVVLIAATARSEKKMEHSTYDAITPCRETIEAPRDIKYTVMGISLSSPSSGLLFDEFAVWKRLKYNNS